MSTWNDDWSLEEPGEEVDDDSSDTKRRSIRLDSLANFWGFDRRELEKRGTGKKRKFTVHGPNGDFEIWSHTYPNVSYVCGEQLPSAPASDGPKPSRSKH